MQAWLESCEDWLVTRYKEILGLDLGGDEARLRWLSTDSLTEECERNDAQNIVILVGFCSCSHMFQKLWNIRSVRRSDYARACSGNPITLELRRPDYKKIRTAHGD